jgi:SAM-dependent methyltransferase
MDRSFARRGLERVKGLVSPGAPATFSVEVALAADPGDIKRESGDIFYLEVDIRNNGNTPLDSRREDNPDYISYHWKSGAGASLDRDGLRTPFLEAVPPGARVVLPMRVSVTPTAGEAVIVVDVVREGVAWSSELGGSTVDVGCTITSGGAAGLMEGLLTRDSRVVTGGAGVAEFWGARADARHSGEEWGWLDHPAVLEECVFPKLGGGQRNWLLAMLERHTIPWGGAWLSLGCGEGAFELWLLENGVADSIAGIDVSPQAVEIAGRQASERGLERARFEVADLNAGSLPVGPFDVVFTSMSLHHVLELESAVSAVEVALRDGGFFLANEYVGPSRFQFPLEQKEAAERLIAALPRELRVHSVESRRTGAAVFKDKYLSRTPEQWEEVDPSEAVRSDEIVGVLERTFAQSWVYPYGGSLLHLVLEHIASNFDPGNARDRELIRLLDACESGLIRSGLFGSDFAVLVARRRAQAPGTGAGEALSHDQPA